MKKIILTLGIAMAALLMPAVVSDVSAQQADRPLKANIPFNFTVCREQLPAGEYTVKHPSPTTLIVQAKDGRSIDIACTNTVQASKAVTQGKLIFNRYGEQYFLTQTWWPGDTTGRELVKSEKEQELIKEYSGKSKKTEKVDIKIVKP